MLGVSVENLGLFVFFAVSGFLISESWIRTPRIGSYSTQSHLAHLPRPDRRDIPQFRRIRSRGDHPQHRRLFFEFWFLAILDERHTPSGFCASGGIPGCALRRFGEWLALDTSSGVLLLSRRTPAFQRSPQISSRQRHRIRSRRSGLQPPGERTDRYLRDIHQQGRGTLVLLRRGGAVGAHVTTNQGTA